MIEFEFIFLYFCSDDEGVDSDDDVEGSEEEEPEEEEVCFISLLLQCYVNIIQYAI